MCTDRINLQTVFHADRFISVQLLCQFSWFYSICGYCSALITLPWFLTHALIVWHVYVLLLSFSSWVCCIVGVFQVVNLTPPTLTAMNHLASVKGLFPPCHVYVIQPCRITQHSRFAYLNCISTASKSLLCDVSIAFY